MFTSEQARLIPQPGLAHVIRKGMYILGASFERESCLAFYFRREICIIFSAKG